ncbi:MAG: ComEC/Rec2 family competence protein [Deltaproteobacteria bacterium]|nr:ComEC/Rec2 family competence protein [Deltaproteobacteria bacterium]
MLAWDAGKMGAWRGRLWGPAALAVAAGTALGLAAETALMWAWIGLAASVVAVLLPGDAAARRVAAGLLLLALATVRAGTSQSDSPPLDLPQPRVWPPLHELTVASEPEWTPTGYRFAADWLWRCPPAVTPGVCEVRWGQLRVEVRGRDVRVGRGQRVRIPGFIAPPLAFGNPGSIDLGPAWRAQQRWGSLRVADGARIAVLEPSPWPWDRGLDLLGRWRRWAAMAVARRYPAQDAAVVGAMALGDRLSEWPALDEFLRETGTSHVLAVSGSHLALVVGALRWALRAALRRWGLGLLRRAHLAAWTAGPLLGATWTYTALTGAAESTLRAAWMVSIALLGEAWQRRMDPLELLGMAAAVMLLADPPAIVDVGLQLSLAGVVGLIWAGQRPGGPLRQAWHASVAAFASTSPIAALRLGQVAVAALPVNLVALPYAVALLPVCLVGVALAAWPGATAAWLSATVVHALLWPLRSAVTLSNGAWPLVFPHGLVAWALAPVLPLAVAAWWHGRRWRWAAAGSLLALALAIGWQVRAQQVPPGQVRLSHFDVGHGDATLVQFDSGATWLVDGGGAQGDQGRVGNVALLPALRALGVRRIDRLVLSHAHPDHENGLLAVARHLPIGAFWYTGQPGAGPEHDQLMALLASVPRVPLDRPSEVVGSARIQQLWPRPAPYRDGLGLNDNSLVFRLEVAGHSALLAGDIEAAAETALLDARALNQATVLKVPHHGSRTSSTPAFLDAVAPQLAVAGARSWGPLPFPHGEVRARYRNHGARLWSTEQGMVVVTLGPCGVLARQAARSLQLGPCEAATAKAPITYPNLTVSVAAGRDSAGWRLTQHH